MNKHTFTLGLLVSALPLLASAKGALNLTKGDFVSAERITREGKTLVSVKLSKSGKAKLKKLHDGKVHTEVAGVTSDFVLREPIREDGAEFGPFTPDEAQKIVSEVNLK